MAGKAKVLSWLVQANERGDTEAVKRLAFRLSKLLEQAPKISDVWAMGYQAGAEYGVPLNEEDLERLSHKWASFACSKIKGPDVAQDFIMGELDDLLESEYDNDNEPAPDDISFSPLN